MRAVLREAYGPPADLRLGEVEVPRPEAGQVLLRVEAASVNPLDWHEVTGTPYFLRIQTGIRRPEQAAVGHDVAGEVVALGEGVTGFAPGDRVFGSAVGSLAEYAVAKADRIVARPDALTAEEAAALPVAAITALQALRVAEVGAGDRVLVNGAAGGVGTSTVQIAVALGAEVTAVCSAGKADLVRSLGAAHVIDYTAEDFTAARDRYDVMIDNVVDRRVGSCLRVLRPGGRYVMVGGRKDRLWLGPVRRVVVGLVRGVISSRKVAMILAEEHADDLAELAAMTERGELRSVIGHRFPLEEAGAALDVIGHGHATGKVVVVPGRQ